jgi:cytochrome c oxidase subunit 1
MPRRTWRYDAGQGLDSNNHLATYGAYLIAIGTIFFVWNWFRSMKKGEIAGNDPWGGATLEWMIPSPPPDYNFATIPNVTSRYPLWDRKSPHLTSDVPHGDEGESKMDVKLAGQSTGSVHTPSDTTLNAAGPGRATSRTTTPTAKELGIMMPTPTIRPLLAALSLGTVFIGLIYHRNLPIMFVAAACFVLSLYSWLLTPLEPEHH